MKSFKLAGYASSSFKCTITASAITSKNTGDALPHVKKSQAEQSVLKLIALGDRPSQQCCA
eukprot:10671853-Karenia_brevis.AAC.1